MAEQAERRAVHPRPQTRDEVGPAGHLGEQLALEPGPLEQAAQPLLRLRLVAGRVDRLEADQPLEQLDGAALEVRAIGHAGEYPSGPADGP